jgi:hypothetical protein
MARFVKVGRRWINLDLVTDVEERDKHWFEAPREYGPALVVTFAAPTADSRGASDWVTDARELVLTGDEADRMRRLLDRSVDYSLDPERHYPEGREGVNLYPTGALLAELARRGVDAGPR